MSARISIDCTRPFVISKDKTKEKLAGLVGLNKSTVQDIKAKIDNYGSPLPHKEDPFVSYKEINMDSTKLDAFVCIETLRSTYDRLAFKSYRATHKLTLAARHRKSRLRWAKKHIHWTKDQWKNVAWSDEPRFCMFHPWFTNGTMHQKRDFTFQEDGASCYTGGYARW
ncbi:hypothetical protein G6F46_010719 [Rhizopus delemar]|uniref:Transposase Tc1-like domain-containing protein n=1 Tax=Rhizopus oryzae TaxID=64495 RepID=A0A9P7C5I0_RHIOR|nr:hypothetical protein G6F55_009988 [Rhizopus delemar]KAG1536764.1 hypothetical protein G6F51_010780 [Rhizopus arrhizus]KAG1504061.1 hypothetical protein G6F53_010481 [Rhizopus delemar]KAG1543731.1 hypothetical protein G6F49_011272 [Rhizopus delemar]KAG1579306.1 hypothetical protein G6F48_011263 [Rhizopus delemar]